MTVTTRGTAVGEPGSSAAPARRFRGRSTAWRIPRWLPAPAVGVAAGALAFTGSGNPSYWGDEAASVLAATRPLPVLWQMLGHVDAVHGAYYLFLHVWIGWFGSAEGVARFPSAVATGFAAAGVVVLARQLFGTPTGVLAGLVFAIIPQVTRMGVEARSYAFGMAVAVWLTHWFIVLLRRRIVRRRDWVLFAVASAASVYLFLYLALLVLVHLAAAMSLRPGRAVVRRWLWSLSIALVLALPILIAGVAERGQIAFLGRRDYATASSVLVGQWFELPAFAMVAWALMLIAPIGVLTSRRRTDERYGLAIIAVWVVMPTAILIIGNELLTPMYNLRYVTFCTPAVAILIALGVRTLVGALSGTRTPLAGTALTFALLAGLAAPAIIGQRGEFAKDDGSDLRQTADVVAAHATAGDAIVFDQSVKPSRRSRLAIDLYPTAFAGLDDVALTTSFRDRPSLWDAVRPLADVHAELLAHDTVWVVEGSSATPDVASLRALGYTVEASYPVHRSIVYRLVKEPRHVDS
ncbi:glycosyltransferase family 39 protein [Plantibacter flavus]|uniref:glycosyltransferase family 39 protein n=1 Tax=Plantibacter flavus TaxID=150123 RepID=UPI003F1700C9